MFFKIGALQNFANFTEKHLCQSLFFNKVAQLRPATYTGFFLCYLRNFLRTPFFTEHLRWLLLDRIYLTQEFYFQNKIKLDRVKNWLLKIYGNFGDIVLLELSLCLCRFQLRSYCICKLVISELIVIST